jgi:hypothetical protein
MAAAGAEGQVIDRGRLQRKASQPFATYPQWGIAMLKEAEKASAVASSSRDQRRGAGLDADQAGLRLCVTAKSDAHVRVGSEADT